MFTNPISRVGLFLIILTSFTISYSCDMIAMLARDKHYLSDFNYSYLDTIPYNTTAELISFLEGEIGSNNSDGYGFVVHSENSPTIIDDYIAHIDSSTNLSLLDSLRGIIDDESSKGKISLVHARNGTGTTKGNHPFYINMDWDRDGKIDRGYTFQHNGDCSTLKQKLLDDLNRLPHWFEEHQSNWYGTQDSTALWIDSELLFHFIMSRVERYDGNIVRGIFKSLRSYRSYFNGNTPKVINFVLSDGEAIYIFRNSRMSGNSYQLSMKEFSNGLVGVKTDEPIRNGEIVDRFMLIKVPIEGEIEYYQNILDQPITQNIISEDSRLDYLSYIGGDLRVVNGAKLIISPESEVKFLGNYNIIVEEGSKLEIGEGVKFYSSSEKRYGRESGSKIVVKGDLDIAGSISFLGSSRNNRFEVKSSNPLNLSNIVSNGWSIYTEKCDLQISNSSFNRSQLIIEDCDDVELNSISINNSPGNGLTLFNVDKFSIDDLSIGNSMKDGISIKNSGSSFQGSGIRYSKVFGNRSSGIRGVDSRFSIVNCEISDNGTGINLFDGVVKIGEDQYLENSSNYNRIFNNRGTEISFYDTELIIDDGYNHIYDDIRGGYLLYSNSLNYNLLARNNCWSSDGETFPPQNLFFPQSLGGVGEVGYIIDPIWIFDPSGTISEPTDNIITKISINRPYPNPFNNSTTLSFRLEDLSDLSVSLFNISGAKICDIFKGELDRGAYQFLVDGSNLSSGIYFIKYQLGGEVVDFERLVLVK